MPNHVWLPIGICELAVQKKLVKSLPIYLYLKMFTSGKCHRSSDVFVQLKNDLSIGQKRTLKKHIDILRQENWIGYNASSGYFFIRSFRKVQSNNKRRVQACKVSLADLVNMQAFVTGVLLCNKVRKQKFFWEKINRGNPAASNKNENAIQLGYSFDSPDHFGLSNKAIAEILGFKPTRACQLKQEAEKAGYIKTYERFRKILTLEKRDPFIRQQLYQQYPRLKGRLHFRKAKEKNKAVVHLLVQSYDEIQPMISFTTISK